MNNVFILLGEGRRHLIRFDPSERAIASLPIDYSNHQIDPIINPKRMILIESTLADERDQRGRNDDNS